MEDKEKLDIQEQLKNLFGDSHSSYTQDSENIKKPVQMGNAGYDRLLDSPEKLISCRHEIIFDIIANVLEENDLGETVGTKEICVKKYHIPVPSNKDYNEYMQVFFSYLEKNITNAAINANTIKDIEQ
jgi:hypothetical protein